MGTGNSLSHERAYHFESGTNGTLDWGSQETLISQVGRIHNRRRWEMEVA